VGHEPHDPFLDRPSGDASLWRYLDFAKFVDMLDRETLFFARADTMIDPWEGGIGELGLEAHLAHYRELLTSPLPDGYEHVRWDEDELRSSYIAELELARRRTYLSCWHMAEYESAAMWSVYAGQDRGIAVRSTFERLEACLHLEPEYSMYAGRVEYIDYTIESPPHGNRFFPFLFKRRSFDYERELRAVARVLRPGQEDGPAEGVHVRADVRELMTRVYVSPDAPEWLVDLVERTVARYGYSVPVEQSDLLTGPLV
jgi:hypothetical protein